MACISQHIHETVPFALVLLTKESSMKIAHLSNGMMCCEAMQRVNDLTVKSADNGAPRAFLW